MVALPVELSAGVALVLKDKRETKKVRNKQKAISVQQERTSERKKEDKREIGTVLRQFNETRTCKSNPGHPQSGATEREQILQTESTFSV
jgi:hypothetical protein